MIDYRNALIYQVIDDDGKRYIGHTTMSLSRRLNYHRNSALREPMIYTKRDWYLHTAIREKGSDVFYIMLLEAPELPTKDEIEYRVRQLVQDFQTNDPQYGYN